MALRTIGGSLNDDIFLGFSPRLETSDAGDWPALRCSVSGNSTPARRERNEEIKMTFLIKTLNYCVMSIK